MGWNQTNLVVVSNIIYVHPYLGKISNLINIVQMGETTNQQYSWVFSRGESFSTLAVIISPSI